MYYEKMLKLLSGYREQLEKQDKKGYLSIFIMESETAYEFLCVELGRPPKGSEVSDLLTCHWFSDLWKKK